MLTRHSRLRRRTRLRPISAKRTHWGRIYAAKRSRFLGAHPVCQRCDAFRSTDIHHTCGRAGGNYCDESTWLALCRFCHTWVHKHPREAREQNLLK